MKIATADFDYVREMVQREAAIVIEPGREYLVESRLAGVARSAGMASLDELLAALRRNQTTDLRRRVIEAMTTNETSFFRDAAYYEALRDRVIPELLAARATSKTLTIWSAAASTGQEVYSTAMLLRELGPKLAGFTIRLIASDYCASMLERCRNGIYSQLEVNRGLPAALLARYFERAGTNWQVRAELRQMVQFEQVNLAQAWRGLPIFDLVFLRNVLIYFSVDTKKDILARVRQQLRPDGYLILGGAETTINIDPSYQRTEFGKAVLYKPKS